MYLVVVWDNEDYVEVLFGELKDSGFFFKLFMFFEVIFLDIMQKYKDNVVYKMIKMWILIFSFYLIVCKRV